MLPLLLLVLLFVRALFTSKLEVGFLLKTVLKLDLKIPVIDCGVSIFAIDDAADSFKFLLLLIDFKLLHPLPLLLLVAVTAVVMLSTFGVLLFCREFD